MTHSLGQTVFEVEVVIQVTVTCAHICIGLYSRYEF